MDYYDITSPVVKFDSLHVLLAIANALDWEIKMTDVKGAYLNSNLERIPMHRRGSLRRALGENQGTPVPGDAPQQQRAWIECRHIEVER
jgi:hypothetical protein